MCSLRNFEDVLHSERMGTWTVATGSEDPPLLVGLHLAPRGIHQREDFHRNIGHLFDNIQGTESCKSWHESLSSREK